jgi:DNA-binding NtrC family response regulator
LAGIALHVPPLRERKSEIEGLARHFLDGAASSSQRPSVPRLSDEVLQRFCQYDWPGNIRELRNVVEQALVLCEGEVILLEHLADELVASTLGPRAVTPPLGVPAPANAQGASHPPSEPLDRDAIVVGLARCAGNQTQAAKLLGISRRTLLRRLDQLQLPRPRK